MIVVAAGQNRRPEQSRYVSGLLASWQLLKLEAVAAAEGEPLTTPGGTSCSGSHSPYFLLMAIAVTVPAEVPAHGPHFEALHDEADEKGPARRTRHFLVLSAGSSASSRFHVVGLSISLGGVSSARDRQEQPASSASARITEERVILFG